MTAARCSPGLKNPSPVGLYPHAKAEMPPPSFAIRGTIAQRRRSNIANAGHVGNAMRACHSEISRPVKRRLKPREPVYNAPSRNSPFNKNIPSLPPRHPKLYPKPRLTGPSPLSKTVEFHEGVLVPKTDLKPLPSAPLFGPISVKPDASRLKQDSARTKIVIKKESNECQGPLDPMHQTSTTPPDWQGRMGVLRVDTDISFGNVTSIQRMTGLPFGGMVEMAEFYGSQA